MCSCKCTLWMVLEWNVLEDCVCSIFDLYSRLHQEGLRPHMHGGWKSLVRVSSIASMGSCFSSCLYTLSDLKLCTVVYSGFFSASNCLVYCMQSTL